MTRNVILWGSVGLLTLILYTVILVFESAFGIYGVSHTDHVVWITAAMILYLVYRLHRVEERLRSIEEKLDTALARNKTDR